MIVNFYIRFSTRFGQTLFVSGNNHALGNDDVVKAISLQHLNEEFWHGQVEFTKEDLSRTELQYKYIF